jgi:hypothetical protein
MESWIEKQKKMGEKTLLLTLNRILKSPTKKFVVVMEVCFG